MYHFFTMLFTSLMCYKVLLANVSENAISQKTIQLNQCLQNCWGVDPQTTRFLHKYFKAPLENSEGHVLIDDFISKSEKLNIEFPLDKELPSLPHDDGVILATKFHPVVFESPFVRIMAGCAEPGEREPFHTHCWKSLIIIFDESKYFVEYANGTSELLVLQPGVYVLPPEDMYACTNLGTKKENCLRLEVKD